MNKIKIYSNRKIIKEEFDDGTQYENLATTLYFEFPEKVEKNGIEFDTEKLNKYIVFNIENENSDLIIDNKYSIPKSITELGKVETCIHLKEASNETDDMNDKLIWISDTFLLNFDKSIKDNDLIVTEEKLDAFNSLYTKLNLQISNVKNLQNYQEQFKKDVESGKYNGKDGYTPQKRNRLFYK